jgi:hypothetical protein
MTEAGDAGEDLIDRRGADVVRDRTLEADL